MAITINLRYKGANARAFAEEMTASGTVDLIRTEAGNLRYEYYISFDDPETVLLIDSWTDQAAMKYDLHMTVERFVSIEENAGDERFIRK